MFYSTASTGASLAPQDWASELKRWFLMLATEGSTC
jgi:hypothetical protein